MNDHAREKELLLLPDPSTAQETRVDDPQSSLLHPAAQVYFRAGLIAAREYMARFVESQDPAIAMSIRANWWPSLGNDFGPPRQLNFAEVTVGEYGTDGFRSRTADEISPTQEALPIALGFLQQPPADTGDRITSRAPVFHEFTPDSTDKFCAVCGGRSFAPEHAHDTPPPSRSAAPQVEQVIAEAKKQAACDCDLGRRRAVASGVLPSEFYQHASWCNAAQRSSQVICRLVATLRALTPGAPQEQETKA